MMDRDALVLRLGVEAARRPTDADWLFEVVSHVRRGARFEVTPIGHGELHVWCADVDNRRRGLTTTLNARYYWDGRAWRSVATGRRRRRGARS